MYTRATDLQWNIEDFADKSLTSGFDTSIPQFRTVSQH